LRAALPPVHDMQTTHAANVATRARNRRDA